MEWDPTESQWQAEVVKMATRFGWLAYHTFNSRRSVKGFPDLVLVRERVVYAELKTQTGRVKTEQDEWMDALRAAGQEVYLWRPSDLEEVFACLTRRGS